MNKFMFLSCLSLISLSFQCDAMERDEFRVEKKMKSNGSSEDAFEDPASGRNEILYYQNIFQTNKTNSEARKIALQKRFDDQQSKIEEEKAVKTTTKEENAAQTTIIKSSRRCAENQKDAEKPNAHLASIRAYSEKKEKNVGPNNLQKGSRSLPIQILKVTPETLNSKTTKKTNPNNKNTNKNQK